MRKGLVTLGVVALVLAVSPGFAEAPLLSCLPDVVVSDVEGNAQTADANLFVFSDALDLDEYVSDGDTADNLIRWSFIQSSGPALELNGIASNPAVDTLEPGADDLRQVSNLLTIANVDWMGTDPGGSAPADSMVEMYASDGTTVSQATMKVTTVNATNDVGDPDAVLPAEVVNYGFDAGAEGWTWFEIAGSPDIGTVAHTAAGGALTITESAPHTQIAMFGAYESPRDPSVALTPKMGCIMAARYQVSSDATDQTCPGFRLRGLTSHVSNAGGTWEQDFANEDYTSFNQVQFSTADFAFQAGFGDPDLVSRIPAAGQEYSLMLFPRQVSETLLSNDAAAPVVHYVTIDMLDLEASVDNDAGTLTVDSVVVEGIDRPEIGTGTAVPELTFSDFSTGWTAGTKQLPPGVLNGTGLTATAAADLTITVAPGNENFEAFCEMDTGVALESGRTYRLAFMCTSSEGATGDAGPLVRTNLTSSLFVYSAVLELQGGGLLSRLTSTPSLMELWVVAPSEVGAGSGTTEEMKAQFISYQGGNVAQWPFFRAVSGTVTCTELTTEVFDF